MAGVVGATLIHERSWKIGDVPASAEAFRAVRRPLQPAALALDVAPVIVTAGYENFKDLWQPLEVGVGDEVFELTARAWVVTGRVAPAAVP